MKLINYGQMLIEIDSLVGGDFAEDMCMKDTFTEEESRKMAKLIGNVYTIAHGIHCDTCGSKYVIEQKGGNNLTFPQTFPHNDNN